MIENKEYFEKHKYRNPVDYLVRAFVAPKIKFMEKQGCFKRDNIKILDVGSGNGTFSHYFNKYTNQVICVDYSEQLLRANSARSRARATAYQLPFRDNQFDVVFEANLLHHVDNPYQVIKEIKRCSREYIVLIEPNRYNPLMFIFSLLVKAERGVLLSCMKRWRNTITALGIEIVSGMTTGMITQENTPAFMVPILKLFDCKFFLGEYIILVGRKYGS
jgi:SAM-dependent methyltransferase